MDANVALFWLAALGAAFMLVRTARMRPRPKGWVAVCAVLLALDAIVYVAVPDWDGYVAVAAWAVLLFLPGLLTRYVARLTLRTEYRQALTLARLLAWLHPADGFPQYPTFIQGLAEQKEGNVEAARTTMRGLAATASPFSRAAWVHLCRIENRWEELAEQYRLAPYASSDLNSMVMYVRSLGETGNHAALIELFDRVHRSSVQGWYPMGHLSLFAFCGQVEGLERLLSGALVDLPADVADFWRATARETAGRSEAAATLWQSLSHSPDAVVAQALSYRKHHPLLPCPPDLQRHVVVQEAMREMEHESRYGGLMEARGQRRVILLLMAVNVAMFMLEGWKGSSTDDATLQYLGALIPKNVLQGEWWRLITAMFLHAGWLHVTSNLIGLLVLGPFVESTLGGARCLLLYLLSGVGANAVFVVLSRHDPNEMLVGASGAIMGLAGASAAIVLRGWKKEGSAAARRGVGNIAAMLAMQVAFDFNVPGVSDLCHMLGFALGLISGFLLIPRRPMEGGPAARGCERVGHP